MASITQSGKAMRITTPLAKDTLLVERLTCSERVSDAFVMQLDLVSENASIASSDLLFKPVAVSIELEGGGQRFLHGLVRSFAQLGKAQNIVSYRAEVVPKVWFQSLTTDCRIFQQKKVPDILKTLLDEAGVKHEILLTGAYPVRDYCVQYRETGFAFISRLMEEEGIFYFFRHDADKHTMIITDISSEIRAGPVSKLSMGAVENDSVSIMELEVRSDVVSNKYTLADYSDILARSVDNFESNESADAFPRFDYPGGFGTVEEGRRLAKIRLEEVACRGMMINGRTHYRGLGSGQKFDVANHYRRDINQSYHVLAAHHMATEPSYRGGDQSFSFETTFEAIPHAVPFRPSRSTPRSLVQGTQTAVVVGPAGEEIFVDKYGRVKVHFFWDRNPKKDDTSSCWVRVSSTWAGKQWGSIQIPRIGQEVVVDFLEGNPDRPIIVGRVYNADQMPPYALPGNGTQSGVKTRSSPTGSNANANELRFEDKKGQEELLIHAERDFTLGVENDETHSVGQDRKVTVERDQTTHVKRTRTETVDMNEMLTVGGKREAVIALGEKIVVGAGDHTTSVKSGNAILNAPSGRVTYEALNGIELKVGQSSIVIDQAGVTIKGMNIKIDGSVQTEVKGLMTKVNATAQLTVKGAITMIN